MVSAHVNLTSLSNAMIFLRGMCCTINLLIGKPTARIPTHQAMRKCVLSQHKSQSMHKLAKEIEGSQKRRAPHYENLPLTQLPLCFLVYLQIAEKRKVRRVWVWSAKLGCSHDRCAIKMSDIASCSVASATILCCLSDDKITVRNNTCKLTVGLSPEDPLLV